MMAVVAHPARETSDPEVVHVHKQPGNSFI